jgi:pyruvate dehydrogenase E2 component (dihydrolipoamide acetyltransferase)
MSPVVDLVMPKLGLTMTEGRIARWTVQPGGRFAAGDVVVVVETDKIANEVEAPAGGVLLEVLEPEGSIAPVGKPIARWRLDEAVPAGRNSGDSTPPPAHGNAPDAAQSVVQRRARAQDGRVISTPYARRLAREAGIELAGMTGTGPRGRIKGADVIRALEARKRAGAIPSVGPSQPQAPICSAAIAAPRTAPVARLLSFAAADVDMGRLLAIGQSLEKCAARPIFAPRDIVVLACLRTLGSGLGHGAAPVIGVELETADGAVFGALKVRGRITLSSLAAELNDLERRARKEGLRPEEQEAGTLVILSSRGAVRTFAPAAPAGWHAALGLGTVCRRLRPDAQGRPALVHEMRLVLSYDAEAMPHASALRLLGTVKALLEEPFALLAG